MGYVGARTAAPMIYEGLKKLEYRGYDSSGIATLSNNTILSARAKGKLKFLNEKLQTAPLKGVIGIGHTRWATHGKPSDENAHPHSSAQVTVVHNGIIENYVELKMKLKAKGVVFQSQTDSEIIPHLIEHYLNEGNDFLKATLKAISEFSGAFAFVALCTKYPNQIVVAKNASPLIIGLGENENWIASDIPALLDYTKNVLVMEDGEVALIEPEGVAVCSFQGTPIEKKPRHIEWSRAQAEKEGFKHFMLKEIFEQPRSVTDVLMGRLHEDKKEIDLDLSSIDFEKIKRIAMVACGTSWHAALVGKFWLESFTRIPVEVDLASEYRYRDPIVDEHTLLIAISQSGETADTLAALEEAKRKDAKILSICNSVDSSIPRKSDAVIYTQAGPEIGVASTKAFTTQLCVLALLSLDLGAKKKIVPTSEIHDCMHALFSLPRLMEVVLKQSENIGKMASKLKGSKGFLFLGRGSSFPIALEGALKLKEISYIHAEGYSAGEMKHGPIALIDEHLPVVALASGGKVFEKTLSNIQEVKARGGRLVGVVSETDTEVTSLSEFTIRLPKMHDFIRPIVEVLPLQLLSYHVADQLGHDVDQPRNLAKSVTVE